MEKGKKIEITSHVNEKTLNQYIWYIFFFLFSFYFLLSYLLFLFVYYWGDFSHKMYDMTIIC